MSRSKEWTTFLRDNYLSLHESSEDYAKHYMKRNRILIIIFVRLVKLLCILRYMICAFSTDRTILDMMCEYTYLIGNRKIFLLLNLINYLYTTQYRVCS